MIKTISIHPLPVAHKNEGSVLVEWHNPAISADILSIEVHKHGVAWSCRTEAESDFGFIAFDEMDAYALSAIIGDTKRSLDDYVLVPKEPTVQMLKAAQNAHPNWVVGQKSSVIYKAMINAADI